MRYSIVRRTNKKNNNIIKYHLLDRHLFCDVNSVWAYDDMWSLVENLYIGCSINRTTHTYDQAHKFNLVDTIVEFDDLSELKKKYPEVYI